MNITHDELLAVIEKAKQPAEGLTSAEWGEQVFKCCHVSARNRIRMLIKSPDWTVTTGYAPRPDITGVLRQSPVYKIERAKRKR